MNYRKRNTNQHKVELSTMLKIVIAKRNKKRRLLKIQENQGFATSFATEAIVSMENNIVPPKSNFKRKTFTSETEGFQVKNLHLTN